MKLSNYLRKIRNLVLTKLVNLLANLVYIIKFYKKGGINMVLIYVLLILKGTFDFADVLPIFKEHVRERLIELEAEDLIIE